VRFIDADEVNSLLTFPLVMDVFAAAHRRAPILTSDTMMGDSQEMYFIRNAVDPGRFCATKLVTTRAANLVKGDRPAVQAVVVIFDGDTGEPLAVIDGTSLTAWKTAGDSALGARLLARPDAATLLVIGAGAMARPLVRAHVAARPSIEQVWVWNRTPERAVEVIADLAAEGVAVGLASDLDAVIGDVDVITACTRANEPIIAGRLLRPGTHVDLVGGFTPDTREADDDTMRRGRVFVDRRESAADVGDIISPLASGAITESDILGDLHDLVADRVGRRSADDITVFKNAGGGHLDLLTAEAVLRAAGVIDET
jgi:ornithine cyclodeaminase/alanine dehydrogenase-like protein (mu-crystallin family)